MSATVEQQAGRLTLRNRTLYGNYDRFYQNFVPGAVTADKSRLALTAYNNDTRRENVFNQTDLILPLATGGVRHTLLAGVELGRQGTDNFRNTGYFNNAATSIQVPYADPTIATPVTFRQSETDADNHLKTSVAATYFQDRLEISPRVQVVGGIRFDRFDLTSATPWAAPTTWSPPAPPSSTSRFLPSRSTAATPFPTCRARETSSPP